MLILIHGDDLASSRKYFLEQKQKYPDAVLLDGDKVTITDLTQIFEGGELFSDNKNVFIEQMIVKKARGRGRASKKNPDEFSKIVSYLETHASENMIVLWENKELERSALTTFKTATIRPFKLPQTLFLFLDTLKPGNGAKLISLFHQTIATTEVEMVFFMLIRQFRLMLAIAEEGNESIDEVKRLTWQKAKLQQQAALFGKKKLHELYDQLFHIEVGQKTGTLPNTILTSIDFFLLEV